MINLKKGICSLLVCSVLISTAAFAEGMSCSSTQSIDTATGEVTINLSIPSDIPAPNIHIAEFDRNGVFLRMHELEDNKFTFTPDGSKKFLKTFIWDKNQRPLSEAESFELPATLALSENDVLFMRSLMENIANRTETVDIDEKWNMTAEHFGELINSCLASILQNEYPELFYFSGKMGYKSDSETGLLKSVALEYSMSEDEILSANALIEAELAKIESMISEDMSSLEKTLLVHDYIVANYEYDSSYQNRSLYEMVKDKTGVCQGYSYLFKYVMNNIGIECINVPSDDCNHMWNKVKIDEEWYNIDLTFDDPTPNKSTNISHDYFLLTDNELKAADPVQHYKWNAYSWNGTPAPSSAEDTYPFSKLRNIRGASVVKDGVFYCFDQNNNICTIDFENDDLVTVYTGSAFSATAPLAEDFTWYVYGDRSRYYAEPYSAMIMFNNDIFFNSPDKICLFDTENNSASIVFNYTENPQIADDMKDVSNTYFYGLKAEEDGVSAEYALSPNSPVTLLKLTFQSTQSAQNSVWAVLADI